uniref:C2H2-type domain-containing protein n=1 Tax=Clastoptera arizonana TaxID=38151 RepID=A0A1B6EGH7_9HEMI
MALKTHHCNIPKLNEDPSMPELSKVEPVEEIKTGGSEDIPVLSPEDMKQVSNNMSYDINRDRRLLLLESTIEKVADESFVIEEFHLKSRKGFSLLENMDFDKSIVAEEKKNGDLAVDNTNKILEDNKTMKKKKLSSDYINKNCIENNNGAANSTSNDQSMVNDISFEIKNKTLGKANSQSIKKEKRVLKVAINNITKGKLIHYKGTKKVGRPLKSNIILNAAPNRSVKNNTNRFNRKLKAIVRKRRSTNLDLLLKESEKLGEDGSLVVGKRRRIDSLNSVDVNIVDIKIKMEDTNETVQEPLVKKKPGRPKKNKDATLISCDNFKVESEIEGKVLDIGDITLASPKNVSAQKIKSKIIKIIDKCEKDKNEGLLLESKMKQTKLDHILKKSLINSTLIKNNEKISENEKKYKGKPKLKQSTLDSMSELNPTTSNHLIISHSHEKNSLDGGNVTENSFIAIKHLNKIESKVKNKRVITDKESLISEASSSHTNNGKDKMNHDFEDLDEIPLSRVKIESVELNADEYSKDSSKGSTKKIKSKALLSSKNGSKKVKKSSIFHNHTLQVIDSNIRGQSSSEKNYLDYGLNTNENFKVYKVNRLENINSKNNITGNKNVNLEIKLNKKEISNDLELNTINEVVATYTTEESTEATLKKKTRGRPTSSRQIDMSFNKIKSKIEVFNDNKSCGLKPKVIKKNNASGQSEFTINTTVIENTVIQNDSIKIEPQEEISANSGIDDNKSRDHFLLIKSASGDLKESFNKSHFDADEDESLSSLKRKLLSAKITINESNIENKKEELIQKLNTNNISISKSNTNCAELKRKVNKTNNLAHLGVPNIGNITTIKEKLKKRRKLKRILKSNNIDMTNHILKRVTKYKLNLNDQFLKKASKCTTYQPLDSKRKIGIGGSKWKVSVVDSASESNVLCNLTLGSKDGVKIEDDSMHLCNICNEKFTTLESLYEHQSTLSHKQTLKEKPKEIEMCRNTLVNVLNDLEKKTLQVAKVMNQLQHRDSTDSMTEDHRSASTSNLSDVSNLPSNSQNNTIFKKEQTDPSADDAWTSQCSQNQDWDSQEWAMVRATPNWESQQQPWESESNLSSGCASSLGSILDSVNKILTEQEVSAAPAPQYTMADLQKAMGASDEEMAMLEQLGEGSLQEDYVYDNSRPGADIWPKEEGPTFMDLDNQESNPHANTSSNQDAIVPVESQSSTSVQGTESDIMRQCRGLLGRPRRLLSDYELREMVCPTCNKHFLGLSALQTHVAWSHCAPVNSTRPGSGLKRRALLNVCEDIDKRLVCFVCKEIVSTPSHLDVHIQAQHMKKNAVHDNLSANKEEGAEKLKSKMSNALGGLLDRALNNLLGAKQKNAEIDAQPELGALQLLGKLCAVRRRVGNENMKLSGDTLQLLGRLRAAAKRKEMRLGIKGTLGFNSKMSGVNKANLSASVSSDVSSNPEIKPTNLLDHLAVCSNDIDQRPYACPICDVRFLIPSVRNRHIARAHGKYGRKYEEEVQEQIAEQMAMDTYSNSTDDVCDTDWRDAFFPSLDDDQTCDDEVEMNPLCSDCGLSFRSIHEVIRHRKEDHPRRFSAEDKSLITKHEQTGTDSDHNTDMGCQLPAYDNISIDNLPISDNVVDSTISNQTQYQGGSGSTLREDQLCKSLLTDKPIRDDAKEKEEVEEEDFPFDSEMNQLNLQDETDTTNRSLIEDVTKKYEGFDFLLEKGDLESGFDDRKKYQSVLSKRINNRKGRLSYMAEESVRVKAEAALKELNQQRRNKSFLNNARWGVNALKFVKQPCSSSQFNYPSPSTSPSKLRFSTLSDKRLKITNLDDGVPLIKSEMEDTPSGADEKSDVYDFNDDDFLLDRKPFVPIKDLPELGKSKVQLTDEGNTAS